MRRGGGFVAEGAALPLKPCSQLGIAWGNILGGDATSEKARCPMRTRILALIRKRRVLAVKKKSMCLIGTRRVVVVVGVSKSSHNFSHPCKV